MSVKIKINWDNENVVSESVRIYRADTLITTPAQEMLIATIFGNVYEYEDLTTAEGQTYYYMLSAKLGKQEVFTECYEVKVDLPPKVVELNFISSSQRYSAAAVPIYEEAHNVGDINIVLLATYSQLTMPDGYILLGSVGQMYVLGKIFTSQTYSGSSVSANVNYGVAQSILLRPSSPVAEIYADFKAGSYTRPEGGTIANVVMPTLDIPAQGLSFEFGFLRYHNRNVNTVEPITLSSKYTKYQSRLSSDTNGIGAALSFGRKANYGDLMGGSTVTIGSLPTSTVSFNMISMCIYAK